MLSFSPVWVGALRVVSLFLLSWAAYISYAGNLGAFHHGHKSSFVLKHITSMEFLVFGSTFVPLDGALLCFFWRENIWAVSRRKWGHPFSKHDSLKMFGSSRCLVIFFLSYTFWARQLTNLRALLQSHPWWFLRKSAKIITLAIPVYVSLSTSSTPSWMFSGDPFPLLVSTFILHTFPLSLCESRTANSPFSRNLKNSNLPFGGHLQSGPMGTWASMGFGIWWWSSSSLCILLGVGSKSVSYWCFSPHGKESVWQLLMQYLLGPSHLVC